MRLKLSDTRIACRKRKAQKEKGRRRQHFVVHAAAQQDRYGGDAGKKNPIHPLHPVHLLVEYSRKTAFGLTLGKTLSQAFLKEAPPLTVPDGTPHSRRAAREEKKVVKGTYLVGHATNKLGDTVEPLPMKI